MADALVERDGHVLVVTLNRPHRKNAVTEAMLARLLDAWRLADEDDEIRCVIITGAGGSFCSGDDLRSRAGDPGVLDPEVDGQARFAAEPNLHALAYLKEYRLTKPLIAAIEGSCIAGGTEIALAADIRVAGESARFGISEARWGLYPMMGSVVRLPRQIPKTVAAELLLTGRQFQAADALRWGLVGSVVPDGQALRAAKEIAAAICANGPLAVQAILRTLHETDGMQEAAAFAQERSYGMAVFRTEDAKEGPRAFAEKRPPQFRGR